ncbi:enoyl-CoA hydratase-related protein [Rhodococcus opacus]|uniref:enoyl-CoA hydratase-related protein n=1 Tax=Rhodococcus opacus TaxID=37919 RepID=UPI002954F722|nr:enoyl-CoA hydratase-related protein [Rhodococcus opacus]MDV7089129.1 enoyl-CoA hydratase-related protein [Rhodococcus opacus]
MQDHVKYEVTDQIATITLNRPDQLNAMTSAMTHRLTELFDRSDQDDDVRAVIVTGSGRAFCAGADLSEGAGSLRNESVGDALRDVGGLLTLRIFRSRKPVIAAINGSAVGVGLSMTLAMDARVLSDDAKLGFVFAARGIAPDAAASWFLPKIVGLPLALEWCMTGRLFGPGEAIAGGLVRSVHASGDVLTSARELAGEIMANVSPLSAVMTRQLLWTMAGAQHPMEAHRVETAVINFLAQTPDAGEAVRAFFDQRPPVWTSRPGTDLPTWFPWTDEPEFDSLPPVGPI